MLSTILCVPTAGSFFAARGLAQDVGVQYVDSKTPSSYCGLYCVFAAAQSLGVELQLESLIQQKYLTGASGSSSTDLLHLVHDNGLVAKWRSGLTIEDLEFAAQPMILHVRSPATQRYSHWLLFLGFEDDGTAKVYDPPLGKGKLTKANLLAIWDGAALVVAKPLEKAWGWPGCTRTILLVACCAGLMASLYKKVQAGWLLGMGTATVAMFSAVLPEGFAWNPDAIRNVSSAHFDFVLPTITTRELEDGIKANKVLLIDTRPEEAFTDFHFPGAMNVPIGIGEISLSLRLEELKRVVGNRRIVAYCQGIKCGWADKVGSLIQLRTGLPVLVYEEGVNGWISRESQ